MNFLWRPFSKHFGDEKEIFTSTMRDGYCWIPGYAYNEQLDMDMDDPFVVNENLTTFNAPNKTQVLEDYISDMIEDYIGDQMYMPFGCDFSFSNARLAYDNIDKTIAYFNEHN